MGHAKGKRSDSANGAAEAPMQQRHAGGDQGEIILGWHNVAVHLEEAYEAQRRYVLQHQDGETLLRETPDLFECLQRQIEVARALTAETSLHWLQPFPHHCLFDLYTGLFKVKASLHLYGGEYVVVIEDDMTESVAYPCKTVRDAVATLKMHLTKDDTAR